MSTRDLEWDGCVNVRDLGGLTTGDGRSTAWGAIVRADNVRLLTPRGWEQALAYGVRSVVDLRSDRECSDDAPIPASVTAVRISVFDDFDTDEGYWVDLDARVGHLPSRDQYRALYDEALERNADRMAAAVRAVADAPSGGILIHCAGGKDRTGVLAALLLRLAGVPISVIAGDYVHSEHRLRIADSAPADVIDHVLETLEQRHGTVSGYLRHAGLDDAPIQRAADRLSP